MIALTKRQETILGLIVREYVNTPTPISSKLLVENYDLGVSSATVRNDMASLEEMGLIAAPHTSAGRIPTEEGYRYFVQRLIGDSELTSTEQHMIRHQFHQTQLDMDEWYRLAVSVMANTVRSASLITSPVLHQAHFKHIELINTHGTLVLMVMVLDGGDVRQQMLTLAEPVSQEQLSQAATRINSMCVGLNGVTIRVKAGRQDVLEQEIMNLAADLLDGMGTRSWVIYTDGLANILDPSHLLDRMDVTDPHVREDMNRALIESDSTGARQTLHLFEEKSLLDDIIAEIVSPEAQGVQVLIAGEGRWEELSETSMVLARYGIEGLATGALGIMGPTRLQYGRAISTVRYISMLMSDMLAGIYGDGQATDNEH